MHPSITHPEDLPSGHPDIRAQLQRRGLDSTAVAAKTALFQQCLEALPSDGGERFAYWVPGRIELLGKHTDYAGGSGLVTAVDRGICLVASLIEDDQVVVTDVLSGQAARFAISPDLQPRAGHWSNYPMTVARRLARNFSGSCRGLRMAFASDLPAAAGMSSSSALMIATFLALADVNDIWHHAAFPDELRDPLHLAEYLGTIENGQSYADLSGDKGVGTFGGSEDHTAIVCSEPGKIRQYAYCPVRWEREYDFPDGYTIVIASSGVVAEKSGAARQRYNRASALAAEAAEIWRQATGGDEPHLAAIAQRGPEAVARLQKLLAGEGASEETATGLAKRFEHFLVENQTVLPAAGEALAVGDMTSFGAAVDRSQRAAEALLGNQVPETIHLAAAARSLGASAASAFGAGFGGSVWAMIRRQDAELFLAAWQAGYQDAFPGSFQWARFFVTAAGPGCFRLRV